MLPFTYPLKFFILINSVIVGIIGNIIMALSYPNYVAWLKENKPGITLDQINIYMQSGNAIIHTIPMIIAFILLQRCSTFVTSIEDALRYIIYQSILILLWTVIPFHNKNGVDKMKASYPVGSYLCTFFYITVIVYFSIIVMIK